MPITVLIFFSIATLAKLEDPKILISEHSKGNFSDISTNFVAAPWITISGLAYAKASLTEFMFETSSGIDSHNVFWVAS